MEYVISFLMGLNDSFAQVRGQLLLMDPIPSINKVFSLVSQEEHQRNVSLNTNTDVDSMAFYAKNEHKKTNTGKMHSKFQRKDLLWLCRTYCRQVL